ncbi:DUF192 domain-containing protein [Candidatus Azambacteria bacterium]|nr:DUF192 domain-containing protein [Candidatus Azambacteria bacterium]
MIRRSQLLVKNRLIQVELALTLIQKARGLSHRLSLEKDHGMLFVFKTPSFHVFWMTGMKFPIDLIWIDQDYQIIDITKNAQPRFFPQFFRPNQPAQYVLEVNAGFSDLNKIEVGDMISF